MAGSLIKIDEEIVTSAVASVTLTGIDSTYDVYMVKYNDLEFSSDSQVYARVTESGTENTTSNYDAAQKQMKVQLQVIVVYFIYLILIMQVNIVS